MRLAFVDIETTSLDKEAAEPLEIAIVFGDTEVTTEPPENIEFWVPPVERSYANPDSLRINAYYDRCPDLFRVKWRRNQAKEWQDAPGSFNNFDPEGSRTRERNWVAQVIATETAGATLVGAVPNFDEEILRRFCRRNGHVFHPHYHLIDVEALAAGVLQKSPPWNSNDLAKELGIQGEHKHTALGDALWAKEIYDTVMQGKFFSQRHKVEITDEERG